MIENRLPTGNEVLRNIAIAFLLITLLGSSSMPSLERATNLAKVTVNSTCLKGIGNALAMYADSNEGYLPSGENWIDQLIETQDMSPKSFALTLSDCIEGESDVALNKAAAGKKLLELPADLVLAFQTQLEEPDNTRNYPLSERLSLFDKYKGSSNEKIKNVFIHKDWWNITCGPEKLKIHNFNHSAIILFAVGSVKIIHKDKLGTLRWDIENSDFSKVIEQIKESNNIISEKYSDRASIIVPTIYTILLVTAIVFIRVRPISKKYIRTLVTFCLATTFLSAFLGLASEVLHNNSWHFHVGALLGFPIGLWAALCFAAYILNLPEAKQKHTVFYGLLLGVFCSTILHASQAYILDSSYGTIIPGIFYGIAAGYFLAWLFAKLINNIEKSKLNQEGQND